MSTLVLKVIVGIAESVDYSEYRMTRSVSEVNLDDCLTFASDAVRRAFLEHVKTKGDQ